jgi:hypothetical protein
MESTDILRFSDAKESNDENTPKLSKFASSFQVATNKIAIMNSPNILVKKKMKIADGRRGSSLKKYMLLKNASPQARRRFSRSLRKDVSKNINISLKKNLKKSEHSTKAETLNTNSNVNSRPSIFGTRKSSFQTDSEVDSPGIISDKNIVKVKKRKSKFESVKARRRHSKSRKKKSSFHNEEME